MRDHYIGEGHFFRAWFYFEMFKNFGELPIVTKPVDADDDEVHAADADVLLVPVRRRSDPLLVDDQRVEHRTAAPHAALRASYTLVSWRNYSMGFCELRSTRFANVTGEDMSGHGVTPADIFLVEKCLTVFRGMRGAIQQLHVGLCLFGSLQKIRAASADEIAAVPRVATIWKPRSCSCAAIPTIAAPASAIQRALAAWWLPDAWGYGISTEGRPYWASSNTEPPARATNARDSARRERVGSRPGTTGGRRRKAARVRTTRYSKYESTLDDIEEGDSFECTVEIITGICTTVSEAKADLALPIGTGPYRLAGYAKTAYPITRKVAQRVYISSYFKLRQSRSTFCSWNL